MNITTRLLALVDEHSGKPMTAAKFAAALWPDRDPRRMSSAAGRLLMAAERAGHIWWYGSGAHMRPVGQAALTKALAEASAKQQAPQKRQPTLFEKDNVTF